MGRSEEEWGSGQGIRAYLYIHVLTAGKVTLIIWWQLLEANSAERKYKTLFII